MGIKGKIGLALLFIALGVLLGLCFTGNDPGAGIIGAGGAITGFLLRRRTTANPQTVEPGQVDLEKLQADLGDSLTRRRELETGMAGLQDELRNLTAENGNLRSELEQLRNQARRVDLAAEGSKQSGLKLAELAGIGSEDCKPGS